HAPTLEISNDEMVNSSIDPANWDLAVFHGKSNPATVSFKWSATADTTGIDQGGIAVMLDSPEIAANGYLITRRTLKNEIRLWRIVNGQNPSEPIITAPLLARPNPGEELRIAISSDQNGNHFTVFINGRQDATISDSSFFIDPANIVEWYTGVMLAGGRNNNIDDFKILTTGFPVSVEDNETSPPGDFVLSQNYPNPFNPETTIRFQLPKTGLAALKVYDILGREIRVLVNRDLTAGSHSVLWDGRDRSGSPVASGVYFYEMRAGDFREAKRMSLIR
ncbi:MAG: FlgD immunoglobulin-like domain containing protein, partial [bacterium]